MASVGVIVHQMPNDASSKVDDQKAIEQLIIINRYKIFC